MLGRLTSVKFSSFYEARTLRVMLDQITSSSRGGTSCEQLETTTTELQLHGE